MKKIIIVTESQLKNIIDKLVINENIDAKPSGVTLLRKMAYKSVFNFGKFDGYTVEKLLELNHGSYLRFVYYNLSGISFIDEILEKIGIYGEDFDYRIKKPGKDPEYGKEIAEMRSKNLSPDFKKHLNSYLKRKNGADEKRRDRDDFTKYSPGNLQRINQGRKN
jgi:hypothetical protein